jgi:malate dehydrogenase (quinone)
MLNKKPDVVLIGAGIMSATLGTLLKLLDPNFKILILEQLDKVAQESSDGWNNAGTGHAGYCELNYTPVQDDGTINGDKANEINQSFEVSLQFWSYLVQNGLLPEPEQFINPTPHMNFVWGKDNVKYLHDRYQTLKK